MINNQPKTQLNLIKKLVIYRLLFAMVGGFLIAPVSAIEPLRIGGISINAGDTTATITWQTNRPAQGKIEYGLYSGDYHWRLQTNQKKDEQTMTIFGLFPETTYFFKITATDDFSEVVSFEQNFKTKKYSDSKLPEISDVQVSYLTGRTATIQWFTNEDATSEVEYGMTTNYGSYRSDGQLVKIHDITISGLTEGTYYHFLVKSKDRDNNIARWYDMTFRTNITSKLDNDDLIIYNIQPASENDPNVTQNSAIISWRTNKLAEGWVRYGTSSAYGKTIATNPPRDFSHSITLINLTPGTSYYFEIEARDVFGKKVKSTGNSFTTKSTASTSNNPTGSYHQSYQGRVLGAATCDINLSTDFGFFGLYYNLNENHPDVELSPRPWGKIARDNDWYNPEYFSFSRVDDNLDFGRNFLPVNEGKPGDPFHFAVNWRAIINVPQDDFYSYEIASDDDSWVFIDDKLITNLAGIHSAKTAKERIELTAGYHKLEIYYAERARKDASFSFKPDSRLRFHPLPDGCELADVLEYNQMFGTGAGQLDNQSGSILGSQYNQYNDIYGGYACNPNLGYTRFKSLYKTPESPDVWAILETGQKHYITSPEAFNKYQCDWGKIKTVSQKFLDGFTSARLVRTIDNPIIYYLFQRPEVKWLKINFSSPTVFISYLNNYWGNVARVDILDIQSYPDAQLIKTANSPAAYLIEGTKKRHIKSEEVFERYSFDWAEVVEINQTHLDSYEDGPDLE